MYDAFENKVKSEIGKIKIGCSIKTISEKEIGYGFNTETKSAIESALEIIEPNIGGDTNILFVTHYPTKDEAKLIINSNRISTVVTKYPYKNEDGITVLLENSIKVVEEPVTIDDILVREGIVILENATPTETETGIIIPESVSRSNTRTTLCEVKACSLDSKLLKDGQFIYIDVMSVQWLSLPDENNKEVKYWQTEEKEILARLMSE